MKPIFKKILIGVGGLVAVAVLGGFAFVRSYTSSYEESMEKVYDVPLRKVSTSADPAVLARGEHLARSLGGCALKECHGADLGGGESISMGPLGTMTGPNITGGGFGAAYSDGELARLIQHGIKKDGRSVRFMPMHEHGWLPDEDVDAVISFVRSKPSVSKPNGVIEVGLLAKILDRNDGIVMDVARRIDHTKAETVPEPAPSAEYGAFIGRACSGCHGNTFSGGPIPGAPPEIPIPPNITKHDTGIAAWTYADFEKMLDTGIKKNGEKLDPFMPLEMLTNMDQTERKALWEFLQSVPPAPFGNR